MSYRSSYTPWKSSLSPNYKTGASSAYSSRDDVSSTSRYSSLASPSSYRPSFSGGTYRLKRDTPVVPASTYVSRYSAAGSSASSKPDTSSTSDSSASKPGQLKRYGSTASSLGKYSREPSPAALEHTNRIKSRDPSPATRSLRGKSRDPSPALDTKCKIGYGSSTNSYRMNVPKSTSTSTTYGGTRYGSSAASSRAPAANNSSTSISYLSASDFKARSLSKAREAATRKSNEKELEAQKAEDKEEHKQEATSNEESTGSSETDEEDEEEEDDDEEEEKFVSVSVCTRATSPTPPGTAPTIHRTRRIEIAKTIEKTIQRSTRKKKMLEKEIQSDRLDDSTRYSRFGLSSRVSSPYSPHTDRYTSSSLRYSHSPLSTTSTKSSSLNSTSTESKKEDVSASSTSMSSRANKCPPNSKSKLSPPKSIKITSRQSSVENLSAHKPPAAPKGESPTKSLSSSTSASTKLPNKDFRKSALNVGPTDRPRKSRTPSTGTDSDLNTVEALNGALQAIQRLERSPSAGSEVSNASNRSVRRTGTDSKLRPRCHNKSLANSAVMSPKSPLSRNNSTSNIKPKSSTSSSTNTQSSAGSSSTAGTTTTSSSSGTESCTESKKSTKKIIKKKAIKDVTSSSTSTTTNTPTTNSTPDSRSIKSSSENSFSQHQPPAASINKAKKSDSSTTSRTTPKTPSTDKDPLRRLKKLSSVSNFLAAQQQDNTNSDEQIYLESSENSSSGNDLDRSLSKKSISLTQANETKTTPSPAIKTKTSGSSSKSNTNSLDEPKNAIKSTKSTTSSSSSTKTKTKTKTKTNTKSSTTSTSYCPQDTTTVNESSIMPSELQTESVSPYTTTNPTTSSTSGTDQEESSWWQDTSRQIDTASALDFNLKDEMRFKIRHIDSGETAWWLRNDEDDTLADDDLKTLNQEEELEEDEEEDEEATDQLQSLTSTPSGNAAKLNDKPGWWIANETNDESRNEDEDKHETIYVKSRSSHDLDYTTNGYCVEEAPVEAKPFPKSRITPETDWWNDENEEAENEFKVNEIPSLNSDKNSNKSSNNLSQLSDKLPKQNGSIQLKICRVESGEKPWWLQEEQPETQANENEITVEATIALPKKTKDKPDSSSSNSDSKTRWMSGPTKKLFNIQRVESGEKAWWQEESSESKVDKVDQSKTYKRNNSQEQEWWLEDSSQQQKTPTTPQHNYQQNGYFEPHPPPQIQQHQPQFYNHVEDEAELQQYQSTPYQNQNNLIDSQAELSNSFNFEYSERPPPLGQCASPVQQEELLPPPPMQQQQQRPHCKSPYDNIPMTKVQTAASQQPILETPTNYMTSGGPIYQQDVIYLNQSPLQQQQQQQYFPHQRQQNQNYLQQPPTPYNQYNNNELRSRNNQLFISRHQNIDELLGGSCRPISPLYYDNGSFQTMPPQQQQQQPPPSLPPPQQRNMFVEEVTPDQVRIHDSTAQMPIIQRMERDDWQRDSLAAKPTTPPRFEQRMIDDAAIQVYKDGDYGSYLDLESSLAEQSEEIEGLNSSRKNSLVVRTQLSVRVHAIIEKLLSAEGSDLRRALFSLKQVFQEDKDLVHAFVALGGLNCLVRVGNGADQNYQNYILRALGQVMLYVDGMNGVMKHEPTMQWLYSLIASNYRSVVKTALKLLLVFVEYAESNCHVLVSAIHAVDKQQGTLPWSNIMRLLKDYDNADAELVIYAASLINKTLEGLNDQDSFYDESDLLEQQGMESVIQHYMSKPGTDMDLLNQLQLYEAVLKFEDGEADGTRLPDNTLRKTQRFRSSTDTAERRKSRRHSTGTSPGSNNINKVLPTHMRLTPTQPALDEDSSSSTNSAEFSGGVFAEKKPRDGAGVTPGLRRRRERAERHRSFLKEQQEVAAAVAANGYMNSSDKREDMATANASLAAGFDYIPQTSTPQNSPVKAISTTPTTKMEDSTPSTPPQRVMSPPVSYPVQNAYNNTIMTTTSVAPPPPPPPPPPPDLWGYANNMRMPPPPPPPPYFYHQQQHHSNNMSYNQNTNNNIPNSNQANNAVNTTTNNNLNSNSDHPNDQLQINESDNEDKKLLLQLKRDHTVKDLTQKLCNLPTSPTTQDDKLQNRIVGDMSGLISKAKEGLAKSKSKGEMSRSSSVDQEIKKPEPKKSENDLQWEELVRNISRPLNLCDLDFTDLNSEDEKDILAPRGFGRGIPPPPPPLGGVALPPPMMPSHLVCPPPMNHPMSMSNTSNGSGALIPPPMFSYSGYGNASLTNSFNSSMNGSINGDMSSMNTIKKNKKTVKLFWKEVREDLIPVSVGKTIWDELPAANVDTQKLEHLFESRAKDLMTKKQQEMNKSKEVIVLDHKRSNAINIAMTKLPPPRAIKAAILKMDATVVTREGIDKLLNMLPTDEEKGKIQEAQMANPELPLGSAEQFLLTLASISELAARLRLWAFRLDFDNSEKEIAEPLMDLKQGIEILKNNRTFKCILSTLLSVGIFLNGAPVKGFQIEYLSKVPEVKDTVHKHSLLHHLCHMVMESGNETTDLYSEIGPITRASKADYNDLAHNLSQLEHECKASWDRLKLIAKHDCPPQLKQKLVDFLADCAERIIILQVVHRRIMNRYRKFLLWLGVPQHSVADSRPNEFCRIVSEFALEYRTTRERVQQQIEKKANHRERNKTRGKLIVDIARFKTKEDKQDAELKSLLGTPNADTPDGTLTWRRRRAENLRSPVLRQSEENFTDGDDEILESLVKTATKAPGTRTTPRERKRTRHADRKSLKRSRTREGFTVERVPSP